MVLSREVETGTGSGPEAVCVRIADVVRELGGEVGAVGVGFPGPLDPEAGIVHGAPNLPGTRSFRLRERLAGLLGLPVVVDNDANCAALGEWWAGAGRRARMVVCVTLGTGIGGGIVIDGRIWHGAAGIAGEIGHVQVDPRGPDCNCGSRGCLELYASAGALVAAYGRETGQAVDAEGVARRAASGDEAARRVLDEAGELLGRAAAFVVDFLGPDRLLFTGGVAGAWELMAPSIRGVVATTCWEQAVAAVRIDRGELGTLAGVYGAAFLAGAGQGARV